MEESRVFALVESGNVYLMLGSFRKVKFLLASGSCFALYNFNKLDIRSLNCGFGLVLLNMEWFSRLVSELKIIRLCALCL